MTDLDIPTWATSVEEGENGLKYVDQAIERVEESIDFSLTTAMRQTWFGLSPNDSLDGAIIMKMRLAVLKEMRKRMVAVVEAIKKPAA